MSSTASSLTTSRTAYPSDVTDEEWAFVAPYLVLLEDAGQRRYPLREGHSYRSLCRSMGRLAPSRSVPTA